MTETELKKMASNMSKELSSTCSERLAEVLVSVYRAGFREGAKERRRIPATPKKGGNHAWDVQLSLMLPINAPTPRDAARAILQVAQETLSTAWIEVTATGTVKPPKRFLVTPTEQVGKFAVELSPQVKKTDEYGQGGGK